jgi:hypothetical protein
MTGLVALSAIDATASKLSARVAEIQTVFKV